MGLKQIKKNKPRPKISFVLLFVVTLLALTITFSINSLSKKEISKDICVFKEIGISLVLPSNNWSCHSEIENNYFYVEPPWVEVKPNTGAHRQFTISFGKLKDYSIGIDNDPRFCSTKEYTLTNKKCLISSFYSHNDFRILRYTGQKVVGLGGTYKYIGFFDNFIKVEFNPSTYEYKLTEEDKTNFDKLFDSIKRI